MTRYRLLAASALAIAAVTVHAADGASPATTGSASQQRLPGATAPAGDPSNPAASRSVDGSLDSTRQGLAHPNAGAAATPGRKSKDNLPTLPQNTPATPSAEPSGAGGTTPVTSPTQ